MLEVIHVRRDEERVPRIQKRHEKLALEPHDLGASDRDGIVAKVASHHLDDKEAPRLSGVVARAGKVARVEENDVFPLRSDAVDQAGPPGQAPEWALASAAGSRLASGIARRQHDEVRHAAALVERIIREGLGLELPKEGFELGVDRGRVRFVPARNGNGKGDRGEEREKTGSLANDVPP
jgi:hypothetical protein